MDGVLALTTPPRNPGGHFAFDFAIPHTGKTYPLYIVNGRPPADPDVLRARPGQRVRLRRKPNNPGVGIRQTKVGNSPSSRCPRAPSGHRIIAPTSVARYTPNSLKVLPCETARSNLAANRDDRNRVRERCCQDLAHDRDRHGVKEEVGDR